MFTLGIAMVSWKSSKQTVIARSTMESEFIALDKCGEEAEWLRHFLENIPGWPKPVPPLCIHCDSQSAIGRAQNSMYNGKSRHIRRRHNTIKQQLSTGVISIDYVKSKDNIVDPLTKGLNRELVEKSSKGMGLKPVKEKSMQWIPNLADWRSQDLGSKGQPNYKDLVISLWGSSLIHSYDETVMLIRNRLSYAFNDLYALERVT